VLTLTLVELPGAEGFDPAALADRLQLDLLRGWGAHRDTLAAADAAAPIERVTELLKASAET